MILPLKDCEITSQYGIIRKDGKLHKGIDLISKSGDRAVKAIRGGIVSYAGYDNTGFGNYVVILQEDGFKALYCHLKSYNVEENDIVKEGQVIGIEGMSGNSTGVHLHLEIRKAPHERNDHINAAEYLGILNEVGKVTYILNYEEFEYLGIFDFWRQGYKGQGITIASHEKIAEKVFDDVFCLKYGDADSKYTQHGTLVMDYIRQVVPGATKLAIASYDKIVNKKIESEALSYLLENTPAILTTSNHSGFIDREICIPYYKEIYDKGCFLVCSAGNKQEEINKLASGDLWKAIGACDYNKGNPVRKKTYVAGEEMDFMSLHDLKAEWNTTDNEGTSFSAPLFAAMLALVQCYFKLNTGNKLNHNQLLRFIKDNCLDLEEKGHDPNTGYGLFILPKPWEIDINKYLEVEEEEEMPRYNTLDEVPEWGKATIEKLINLEVLKGEENGNLNLSYELLRTLVIHDRLGLYD